MSETIQNLLNSNFVANITSFSLVDTLLAILVSLLLGLLIFAVYRKTFSGVLYSRNFNISLIAMTMATALIIMGVTSNVVLSLGMVGALSIVRFRTAIKDPMDTFYLFWAIAAGILCGAGQLPLAIIGSVVIALVMLVFVNRVTVDNPYLLIVKSSGERAEKEVVQILTGNVPKFAVKTKTLADGKSEITYEVRLKAKNTSFVNQIDSLPDVESAVILSYDGNFAA
ncbi:DUF4956 domain-containing protein [Ruminococcaceae bacterium OttesenSCG-928-A11]|nr:DUF4956 domain-containing protein [Ruminococcaceae bacterium OttesenSCG-928-A11]